MATPLWKTKAPTQTTLLEIAAAVRWALVEKGADLDLALAFAGYQREAVRQRGYRSGLYYEQALTATTIEFMWNAAVRSKFRFARSPKHSGHYRQVGRMGLPVLAALVRLQADAPEYAIADKVLEEQPVVEGVGPL